ncbi:hypothetical protein EYF80_026969 [Liparis tanakae]|uniref:Uncharacterized protein n=1 Tax=Liparis tanakae TaxID=230148 RepID=A0A4Z2HCK1_9TELE|nr:hypothetical protein EYF80_026969 [Liparis tanakae]
MSAMGKVALLSWNGPFRLHIEVSLRTRQRGLSSPKECQRIDPDAKKTSEIQEDETEVDTPPTQKAGVGRFIDVG